jgi:ABC-type glycerol-3-phosphate transport system substrate-binding protein
MMDCGSADLSGYYEIDPDAQLGFFYWPAADAEHSQVTNTGMSVMYGINPAIDEAKLDAAITFLNWVATPEGAQSMNRNIKLLPVVDGVEPEGDPILTEMVNSPLDIPVWYERWPTLNIGTVWTTDGNSAFDTGSPPDEFAAKLQASVDEQIANAPAATPAS